MYIIELDDDNIFEYLDFVPADIADFMGRVFVYGILVMQDEIPTAGMIWELKNMMSEEPKESSIIWIFKELKRTGISNCFMFLQNCSNMVIYIRRVRAIFM